jgi:hypothetical protein
MGTVGTTKNGVIHLHAMADDMAAAVRTRGREGMNRTLERIERVPLAVTFNDKCLVVIVSANFAFHGNLLLLANGRKASATPDAESAAPIGLARTARRGAVSN